MSAGLGTFCYDGIRAGTFVFVVPILALGLWLISKNAMPAFRRVFKKYDRLNESIEENVRAMRVVKGFAREDYEKEKFKKAAEICPTSSSIPLLEIVSFEPTIKMKIILK